MRITPRALGRRTLHKYVTRLAVWAGMQTLNDGTDTAPVAGTRYWSSITIPDRMSLTGLAYLIGTVGLVSGDKVIVELHDGGGAMIGTSAPGGTAVGAAGTVQQVPFVSPITVDGPGEHYIVVQFNTAVPRFRTVPAGTAFSVTGVTGSAVGAFGITIPITPGSVFTPGAGPIAFTY